MPKIDALFQDFDHPDTPGAAVMVIQNGVILYEKGYGLADLSTKTACSVHTNFRLASLTKEFTAMAIMMLIEKHQISLDDPITKFFPEFPKYGVNITIQQLLNHRSGLLDYEDYIPQGTTIQLSDRDVLHILMQQDKTYFAPGTQFRYSNTGYSFLALIVEVASGQTFPAFLKQHIFDPLQMKQTLAYVQGVSAVPNRAMGYVKEGDQFKPSDQSLTSAVLGDGGIYTSVEDLYNWDQALYTEKLVSKKMLDQAFTSASSSTDFPDSGYGFGWYVSKYRDTNYLWHYGSTCGFSTHIDRFPEKKFTVIVLTNRRDAEISDIARKIADLYF
ncbi:MAG TPA: serine hydrolase domain-containing protein [Acidobacteriota bacterium]|nr:serine hydrolase domain-containing protein [Acidobacteriota bacterium]